jgi:hypothetical protein
LLWERFGASCCVDQNGVLIGLRNEHINIGLTSNDPVERVYQFLEINRDLLHLENPREELPVKSFDCSDSGACYVRLYQKANGIVVEGSYYRFALIPTPDRQGLRLYDLDGAYYPEARQINPVPAISRAQADSIALSDPAHENTRAEASGADKLIICGFDDGLHLVWRVGIINGGYGGSASYLIDANTGIILKSGTALR